jgi:UDP-N-acetylglucosamine 2-epimerase (non-hydrolysing)
MSIVGTRPEAIKMAPVIKLLKNNSAVDHILAATAQHREMLDQALSIFDIAPDIDLDLMQKDQSLAAFAARALFALSELFAREKPTAILIQGDTTTVTAAALAAFYQGICIGHVEAGLRSFDRKNPFPEEINRAIAGCLADLHFAPTERARENLLREGIARENIFVTGNTIVDALRSIPLSDSFDDDELDAINLENRRVLMVTAHRRENHGAPLQSICRALKILAQEHQDIEIIYPVHLNPNVNDVVQAELQNLPRIHLIKPLSYQKLLKLMSRSYLILTDSGGIQEEAPSLHKPVLVLRELTERPEVIEVGAGKVVGTDTERIVAETNRLLMDRNEYERMSQAKNPFGNGDAAQQIVDLLLHRLSKKHLHYIAA